MHARDVPCANQADASQTRSPFRLTRAGIGQDAGRPRALLPTRCASAAPSTATHPAATIRLLILLAATACLATPARAATLSVGPGQRYAAPSAAAAAARPGDRIVIAPGRYRDCAIWTAPNITIEAAPGGAVEIEGPVCGGKALFVTAAPSITIVGITFRGAVAPPGNGAGIRAEGGDLTIRRSRFLDNQNGILTSSLPSATLRIEDSEFIGNGALVGECAHGVYAGRLALVSIRNSRFADTRICHHIKSRALRTEVTGTAILDGEAYEASYQVDIPNGGDLLLAGNTIRKGPRVGNAGTSVAIGAEGVTNPTNRLEIRDNRFANLQQRGTIFVRNLTGTPAVLERNTLEGRVTPLEGPGSVR